MKSVTFQTATALSIRSAALLLALWVLPATACGQIFVTGSDPSNPGSGKIGEYDATTGATVNAALVSGLNASYGMAESGGNLFVTNFGIRGSAGFVPGTGSIGKYTTSGATVNATLVSGLDSPVSIAVYGGNLFVTSYSNSNSGTIAEYTTSGATVNAALVSGLNAPVDIAVSGGNLFVLTGNTIGEYTTSGATVNAALVSPAKLGAHKIAVSGGNLFVTGYYGGGWIGEYNATTGATVNATLVDSFPFGYSPYGIAVVATSVPEPSGMALGLVALAGLSIARIRIGRTGICGFSLPLASSCAASR